MQNNDDIDREHYQLRNLPHRQANVQAYGPAPIGQGVAVPIDNNLIPQPDDEEHVLPDNLFPPPAHDDDVVEGDFIPQVAQPNIQPPQPDGAQAGLPVGNNPQQAPAFIPPPPPLPPILGQHIPNPPHSF